VILLGRVDSAIGIADGGFRLRYRPDAGDHGRLRFAEARGYCLVCAFSAESEWNSRPKMDFAGPREIVGEGVGDICATYDYDVGFIQAADLAICVSASPPTAMKPAQ